MDLFADERDTIWVGVHFGSRGFGHRTASGFLSLAAGGRFQDAGVDGEMDSSPVVLPTGSELGQGYIEAMRLAGAYAHAARRVMSRTQAAGRSRRRTTWQCEIDGCEYRAPARQIPGGGHAPCPRYPDAQLTRHQTPTAVVDGHRRNTADDTASG